MRARTITIMAVLVIGAVLFVPELALAANTNPFGGTSGSGTDLNQMVEKGTSLGKTLIDLLVTFVQLIGAWAVVTGISSLLKQAKMAETGTPTNYGIGFMKIAIGFTAAVVPLLFGAGVSTFF